MLKWLDRVGDLNPQLFRELKGNLKLRNIWLTVGGSILLQFLITAALYRGKCFEYPASECNLDLSQIEWKSVFGTLDWLLPLFLLVGGVYQIIANLSKEERHGTLNFIRLSPQSSENILIGKILGVPALLYLAITAAIPLHFVSGIVSNLPLIWLFGIYIIWGLGCALFYTAAIFLTFFNSAQSQSKSLAWAGFSLASMFGPAYIGMIHFSLEAFKNGWLEKWKWLLIPVGSTPFFSFVWAVLTLTHATYWFWQAINRRFRNPNNSILSKQQSYWLVISVQVWLLGFTLPDLNVNNSYLAIGLGCLFIFNPFFFMVITAALLPQRQALIDWARYRRDRGSNAKKFWTNSLIQDLIWHEKSPAIVAVAINLLITSIIWIPWLLLWPKKSWFDTFQIIPALAGLLLTINVILIYACLTELVMFRMSKRGVLCYGGILGAIFLPITILIGLQLSPEKYPILWLLSGFPVIAIPQAGVATVLAAIVAQWSILALINLQLTRQLRLAGESASQALFASKPPSLRVKG